MPKLMKFLHNAFAHIRLGSSPIASSRNSHTLAHHSCSSSLICAFGIIFASSGNTPFLQLTVILQNIWMSQVLQRLYIVQDVQGGRAYLGISFAAATCPLGPDGGGAEGSS